MAGSGVETPHVIDEPRLMTRNTRIQVLGLLSAAAGLLVFIVAGLVSGMAGDVLPFFGPFALGAVVIAALVWRYGTWAKVLGLLGGLAIGGMFWWTVFGVFYPASVADFVPAILVPLGVVLTLVGGILGIIRRHALEPGSTPAERRTVGVVVGLGLIALVVSGVLALTNRSTVDPEIAAGAIAVEMAHFEYTPEVVTVAAGEATRIVVTNSDPIVHTFSVEELGIDEVVLPGNSALVEFTADAGTYTIYCAPHSMKDGDGEWDGMLGTLVAQ